MCYSAQIEADHRKYLRLTGDDIKLLDFYELFWRRQDDFSLKIPKAVEALFAQPKSAQERQIKALIDAYNAAQATSLEQELFKQRKRLADAERALQSRATKKDAESQRIATAKIEWAKGKLADLRRTELEDRDSRIFPGHYAPVLVMENGRHVVKPMRYQCRLPGKPAFHDTRVPGTYNARRDNLEGFWRDLFGCSHGVAVVQRFYEYVERIGPDGKPYSQVLEFTPADGQELLIACLWSRWTGPDGEELLSFAAITDDPPPEVIAAGHDRCIIPIKAEHLDTWLSPDAHDLEVLHAILDDRVRPYYQHRDAE